jgi:eukaryotic-like serine/threonine-protein kinase
MDGLSAERWRQIDALYTAALEQPPEARDAFAREAAGDDRELYEEVRSLLASEVAAGQALEGPAAEVASLLDDLPAEPSLEPPEALPAGTRVGPYRIVREIARGGMGAVYLAERADEQFEKRVALKLVKRGMDTDEILRRFRYERQILASLEHPHIARLLDGGATEQGQPYLVMEYIPGQPIDRYCDEHRLSVEARLALFESVCEAVQYAHQNLVVHRDLKPSNILVTEAPPAEAGGQVELLDFGIARLLSDDDHAAPHTRTGMRVLTPEYASPEQVSGAPLTVASDVYSLGVVLYRLLTGRSPYRRPGQGAFELERATLEQEAERPSAAVVRRAEPASSAGGSEPSADTIAATRGTTPEGLRRRLRGDLDSIVLKALEKDPARRYGSVEQLLADLRRHRAGLPVEAHSAGLRYRTGKFVRRHRGAVGAAALFVLLLTGFAAAMTLQQRETARERDRAEQERDKAEEVAAFLESLFAASDPFLPEAERLDTLRVRDFLARGAARVQQELGEQPLVQARMLDVVGRVYRAQGLFAEARALLEDALEKRLRLLGEQHPEVAESRTSLALLLADLEEFDRAQQLLEQALAINLRSFGERHPSTAMSLNDLGVLLRLRGRYAEAVQPQRQALAILQLLPGDQRQRLATVTASLASTLEFQGDYAAAEALMLSSLELRRELYGEESLHVAVGLNELSLVLQRQGRYDDAEARIRESLAIVEQGLGEEHRYVAEILNRLASVLGWKKEYADAELHYRRSLALRRKLYGERHNQVAIALNNLGTLLSDRGAHVEAVALNREALAITVETLGRDHAEVPIATGSLASALEAQGECAQAEGLFREALAGLRRTLPTNHVRIPMLQRRLGSCLARLGRPAEAEAELLESYHVLHSSRGGDDSYTRDALDRLVAFYVASGRPQQAAELVARHGGPEQPVAASVTPP